jgi:hypothetical protein
MIMEYYVSLHLVNTISLEISMAGMKKELYCVGHVTTKGEKFLGDERRANRSGG